MRLTRAAAAQFKMAVQLAQLPEVERLSPACIRILGGNPGKFTLQGTNTYLLGTGPERLLVDTGEGKPSWISALKRTLAEEKASVTTTLITHWHHDHVQGVPDLLEFSPGTKVHKNQPGAGQLDIRDGQRFQVPGATVTAFHTPGHTVDHMALVLEEEDAMFTGDNVLGQGTAVFEDLGTYISSLEKMQTLFKGRAYPGHGPVIPEGPTKITEYIQHRRQREEQVIQTLRSKRSDILTSTGAAGDSSAWTPMELVRVIYHDVPETLHPAAAGGVVQILRKLEKDGKVSLERERWTLNGRSPL
jgi:ribonuclease/clavin/mitogillin